MKNQGADRERIKMLNALATVSSLAFMAVADFMLAYFGGNWLDGYFGTGDHTMRSLCIALALVTLCMSYYNLIKNSMPDDEHKKRITDDEF